MQKTTQSALLMAMLSLATLMTQSGQAQDQEEGAVELDGPSPAPEASAPPPPPPSEPSANEMPSDSSADNSASGSGSTPGNLRVFAGPRVGVGGGYKFEESAAVPAGVARVIQPARVTPGFALGADYVLHRYFAIGGETRFDWTSFNERNKWMFWSLLAKPRVRHQLKQFPIELYFAVLGGLQVTSAGQSNQTGKVGGALGLSGGASYFFGEHWAVNAELGWTWHWQRFEAKVPGNGPPQGVNGIPASVKLDYASRFGQMALGVNVVYAL